MIGAYPSEDTKEDIKEMDSDDEDDEDDDKNLIDIQVNGAP